MDNELRNGKREMDEMYKDRPFIQEKIREHRTDLIAVMRFAKTMDVKLRANKHKVHWSKLEQFYLLYRLEQELTELRMAMIDEGASDEEQAKAIISECADVANFAMMISDNIRNNSENAPAHPRRTSINGGKK